LKKGYIVDKDHAELLLGCGRFREKELIINGNGAWRNLVTLDINETLMPDVVWDLTEFPLPFEDNSFDEIHAYEVLEHTGALGDYKFFFKQWEEFYRILKPEGFFCGSVPRSNTDTTFCDPGHCRIIDMNQLIFLDQGFYSNNIRATDYRNIYHADFHAVHYHDNKESQRIYFALKASKPSGIIKNPQPMYGDAARKAGIIKVVGEEPVNESQVS
jgi:hypothetical protein